MEIHPTQDQEEFIRQAVAAGRLLGPEDAIKEALMLWEERERRRADILAAIDEAEASLARGEGRSMSPKSVSALVDEVQQRGRLRLQAGQRSRG